MAQYCRSCGSTLEEGAQFCRVCGAAQDGYNAPAPQPAPTPYQAPYAAPYAQPAPAPQPAPSYYAAPAQQGAPPLGVGEYILMMIVSGIPFIGFIMLLVWAFGSQTNPNKKNWARAILILMLIGIVLSIILSSTLVTVFRDVFESMDGFNY